MSVKSMSFSPNDLAKNFELKIKKFQLASDQRCLFFSKARGWAPKPFIKVRTQ